MRFARPTITDHGSIVQHTFYRCPSGTGSEEAGDPPKNFLDLVQDKFGECSHS